LSLFVLKKFPGAKLTLIDISEGMLQVARSRFKDDPRVRFLVGDYSRFHFEERYDAVISALSIHHLPDSEKERLYHQCYTLLDKEGVFVNADEVLGETPFWEHLYKQEWRRFIEGAGMPQEEIEAGYERVRLDKEAPLDLQLSWLREAGFQDVGCLYKHYNFAVMAGRKHS
jgi:tRNA (cmo5U34)-methyltransferase